MVFSTMSEHCDAEDTRNIEGGAIFVSTLPPSLFASLGHSALSSMPQDSRNKDNIRRRLQTRRLGTRSSSSSTSPNLSFYKNL